MSRAPRKAGRIRIEIASNIGTAKRNIIAEPCIVKSWLNMSAEIRSFSGTQSCNRIKSAITPAISMKVKAVMVYHTPTSELLTAVQ